MKAIGVPMRTIVASRCPVRPVEIGRTCGSGGTCGAEARSPRRGRCVIKADVMRAGDARTDQAELREAPMAEDQHPVARRALTKMPARVTASAMPGPAQRSDEIAQGDDDQRRQQRPLQRAHELRRCCGKLGLLAQRTAGSPRVFHSSNQAGMQISTAAQSAMRTVRRTSRTEWRRAPSSAAISGADGGDQARAGEQQHAEEVHRQRRGGELGARRASRS